MLKQNHSKKRCEIKFAISIGDLIDDEALSKLVERGIEEAFFKQTSRYENYRTVYYDPLIYKVVKELLRESVEKEVEKWLSQNPDKIGEIVNKVISDGVGMALLQAVTNKFQSDLINFGNGIVQRLDTRID